MSAYTGAHAVVVGGSIGGLTAALLLRDLGYSVDVYERSAAPLSGRGSGIVLQPDTVRWFSERSGQPLEALQTATRYVQYLRGSDTPQHHEERVHHFTAWGAFYRGLLSDFGVEHYHLGKQARGFSQTDGNVTVEFLDGSTVAAHLAVFADGISSVARRQFDPVSAPHYSGYVGWRGTYPQDQLSRSAQAVLSDAITFDLMPNSHLVIYPIPGDRETEPQDQLMNYVWYRNVDQGSELEDLLLDNRGHQGTVSVPPGLVREPHVEELKTAAGQQLSPATAEAVLATEQPYLQAVLDVRSTRMATGRVALIGDAACAARPHAAAGTAKAAADAWALATALSESDGDIVGALAKWEPPQLALSDQLMRRVIAMGERFQITNTAIPGDPRLRFGLYGPDR